MKKVLVIFVTNYKSIYFCIFYFLIFVTSQNEKGEKKMFIINLFLVNTANRPHIPEGLNR